MNSGFRTVRLGTRASALALAQSRAVAERLRALPERLAVELVEIRTEGDRLQEAPPLPGERLEKGLFTTALEDALRSGRIDLAVHSLKDLPVAPAEGLVVAAVPPRADARDVLISRGPSLHELPSGARVGTGSPRRRFQLARARPDLRFVPIRGNVDTRIARLRAGDYEAVVLAAAGLIRLGREHEVQETFALDVVLPAPGQGALGLQCRPGPLADLLRERLDDAPSRLAATAERAVLAAIGGGCDLPLGASCVVEGGALRLHAVLFDPSGMHRVEAVADGALADAEAAGAAVGARLLERLAPLLPAAPPGFGHESAGGPA